MKSGPILLLTLCSLIPGYAHGKKAQLQPSSTTSACKKGETWAFSDRIDEKSQYLFQQFINGRITPVRAFSEALAVRRSARTFEERFFSEYWISRALYQSDLVHVAHNGLSVIASRSPHRTTSGVQAAAIDCLLDIQDRFPTLSLQKSIWPQIRILSRSKNPRVQKAAWRAASAIVRTLVSTGANSRQIKPFLTSLQGAQHYESLANGLYSTRNQKHSDVVQWLSVFHHTQNRPADLDKYVDLSRIIYARSLFALKKYDQSVEELKKVEKNSNHLSQALNHLAWSYMRSRRLREAIGTSINLQAGSLRRTFNPESPMIMAMALNELCQYPESVRAVSVFKRRYRKPYQWLHSWNRKYGKKRTDFYRLVLNYLNATKRQLRKFKVPEQIASEWTRSPFFISRQDEINLLFDEQDQSIRVGKKGSREQSQMAKKILAFTKDLKARYTITKKSMKPGGIFPPTILNDLEQLRKDALTYRRFRRAAPVWQRILKSHRSQSRQLERQLVRDVNTDLKAVTKHMLARVEEVAETTQLIEVEIYNGASNDIIWQNAHPDYGEIAKEIKQTDRKAVNAAQTYNWGYTAGGLDGTGEIWEDELGSFKADIYDNCNNKNKYLAIKLQKRRQKTAARSPSNE